MSGKPRQPAGLGAAGKALWRAIVHGYDTPERGRLTFDPREVVLVEQAARQADAIEQLERALKRAGLVTKGSTGQERLNPAVTELRLARLALARLLDAVALPDADATAPVHRSMASQRASNAANSRWTRERARQERAEQRRRAVLAEELAGDDQRRRESLEERRRRIIGGDE